MVLCSRMETNNTFLRADTTHQIEPHLLVPERYLTMLSVSHRDFSFEKTRSPYDCSTALIRRIPVATTARFPVRGSSKPNIGDSIPIKSVSLAEIIRQAL